MKFSALATILVAAAPALAVVEDYTLRCRSDIFAGKDKQSGAAYNYYVDFYKQFCHNAKCPPKFYLPKVQGKWVIGGCLGCVNNKQGPYQVGGYCSWSKGNPSTYKLPAGL
ncbi:hypothetical protein E4U53_007706 [Claviceps sorghi]|nr:hypothetical protein E4U53_007706 [Claviceps sorghi]